MKQEVKRYLGSIFTAYAALVAPFLCFAPILFVTNILSYEISGPTIFLMIGGLVCTFIWFLYLFKVRNQLYSWGDFGCDSVRITTLFSRRKEIKYSKCKSCGIGYYTHGILNSKAGTRVYFIFLSYDFFEEKNRANINLWKPSDTRIKVQYSQKLYNYLIEFLPSQQSRMLKKDYEKMFLEKKKVD